MKKPPYYKSEKSKAKVSKAACRRIAIDLVLRKKDTQTAVAKRFGVSRKTIQRWCLRKQQEGSYAAKSSGAPKKLTKAALRKDRKEYKGDSLRNVGKRFGVSGTAIYYAFKRMNIPFQGKQWKEAGNEQR